MRWRLLGAAFLVLVGAAAVVVVLVRPGAASTGDAQYLTAQVTRSTVTSQIAANGALAPAERWGLAFGQAPALLGSSSSSSSASSGSSGAGSSSVTWPVTAVNVAPGATVKKGDVLATADIASLNAQISQANYTLATAQISLEQATSNLDSATTQQQIWQAKSAYYNAESTVARDKQAKADLVAQKALATITAPADGIIEAVSVRGARGFALGVQWHPEYKAAANPDSVKLFQAFAAAARAYRLTRAQPLRATGS